MISELVAKPGTLSSDDIAHYRDEGYLIVRGLFDESEIQCLGEDVDRVAHAAIGLVDVHNMRVRFTTHQATCASIFEVFDPIADLSPVALAIAHNRRILDRLHNIYGEPAELFKDKLIFKPPGSLGAALHQDWIAWPGFPESFATVLVAIDRFTADSGATEVFPRCHRDGYRAPKDGRYHSIEPADLPTEAVPLLLDPGDVAIFSCFTPHRSAANTSTRSRRGYFISYNAHSDGGDQYAKHYREFHAYLRAKAPSEKRPLLFFR